MLPRDAVPADLDALAQLWFDGWQDAHAELLPDVVRADRTVANLRARLTGELRTIGPVGSPLGFSFVRGDELYQFYVSAAARGTGVAATLIDDVEARMRAAGVATALLDCVIGNGRAARFYEKRGWRRTGVATIVLDLSGTPFSLETWRYEKSLH